MTRILEHRQKNGGAVMAAKIPLGFNRTMLEAGLPAWEYWHPEKQPHLGICGNSGWGKTVMCKLLLFRAAQAGARLIVCDAKGDDYRMLNGCPGFFDATHYADGIDLATEILEAHQINADTEKRMTVILLEEWAAYINLLSTLDKKRAEALKNKLSTLLLLGRSWGLHIVLSAQRFDSALMGAGGAREQLSLIIQLGPVSRESAPMVGIADRSQLAPMFERGQGHLILDGGAEIRPFVVPKVRDFAGLDEAIRRAMMEQTV